MLPDARCTDDAFSFLALTLALGVWFPFPRLSAVDGRTGERGVADREPRFSVLAGKTYDGEGVGASALVVAIASAGRSLLRWALAVALLLVGVIVEPEVVVLRVSVDA